MKSNFSDFRGRIAGWTVALAMTGVVACADDGASGNAIAIAGTWTSDFGEEIITNTTWSNYLVQTVVAFDNATRTAILRNPPDAEWGPNDYSRVEWIGPEGDTLRYCVVVYGQTSEEAARNTAAEGVDQADLDGTGCAGFPWSKLTRKR